LYVSYLINKRNSSVFFCLSIDGFATTDLAFFWENVQNISAIRVNEDLEMPDFVLSNHEAKYCNRTTATGLIIFLCL
jgi:hypothetical protein